MGTYDAPSTGSHHAHRRARDAARRWCMLSAVQPRGDGAPSRGTRRRHWASTLVRGAGSGPKHRTGRDGSVLAALEWAGGSGSKAILSGRPSPQVAFTLNQNPRRQLRGRHAVLHGPNAPSKMEPVVSQYDWWISMNVERERRIIKDVADT